MANSNVNNSVISSTELPVFECFDDMELKDDILRGIYSIGFNDPSPIQQVAIKAYLQGKDLIAQAQSGTGKTGAFSIATLEKLDMSINQPQAIVLSPTRELADQTNNVLTTIGEPLGVKTVLAIGGSKVDENREVIKRGVHVVIGTTGRIIDLCQRGILNTQYVKSIIIDEADEMLSEGFKAQVQTLFGFLSQDCQVGLFSATLSPEVIELTKAFMKEPNKILLKKERVTLEGINQYFVFCEEDRYKLAVVNDLYKYLSVSQTIIFCNVKQRVNELNDFLRSNGHTTEIIHGDMQTKERQEVMKNFRSGSARVLIASDLVCRGIDVQGLGVVINFDIPFKQENYIHRIGRAGRFGRKGLTINLTTKKTHDNLQKIEKYYSCKIEPLPKNVEENIKDFLS
jgi:translation initiation factor 4A